MSSSSPTPLLARANFRFKATNNDELNFKKGDIITVTQPLDGGWWEGTLHGKTGWFPSNYVTPAPPTTTSSTTVPSTSQQHRSPTGLATTTTTTTTTPSSTAAASQQTPLATVEECQMNGHGGTESGGDGGDEEGVVGGAAVVGTSPSSVSHQHHPHHHHVPPLDSSSSSSSSSSAPAAHVLKDFPTRKRESMILYHNVVLDNMIDSEGAFVNDMRALISAVLIPLRLRCGAPIGGGGGGGGGGADEGGGGGEEEAATEDGEDKGSTNGKEDVVCSSLPNNLAPEAGSEKALSSSLPVASPPFHNNDQSCPLSAEEVAKLGGNIDDILQFHQELLQKLEEIKRLPIHEQRVGGLFLSGASKAKTFYEIYFANHPSAIDVLMQRKEELKRFLEGDAGISPPGDLYLTQSLSSVFRRLEKYPTLFKELERYLDEFHADRGDTQRAFSVYQDILLSCHHIRHMRALELEVLVHPFRPSIPTPSAFSLVPNTVATASSSSSSPAAVAAAKIHGWRGEGRLGGEMGTVTLLSEVFVLNLKRLKEEDALANENNNDIHTLTSSQYSENSNATIITSTMGEDGSLASSSSTPLMDVSSVGTVVGDTTATTTDSLLTSSDASSSTPTSRSNAIPIPGASAKDVSSSWPASVLTNGIPESSPRLNAGNSLEQPEVNSSQPPPPSSSTTPSLSTEATKQFLILYPSTLLILSVSPCMKRFVLDCRFDGDATAIVAKVIPPIVASNMLSEADGAMFDSADSSTVSSFPPQNALEFSNLPGSIGGSRGAKLNAIFTSKIDRDVWLERHLPPPSPTQEIGLCVPSQGTSVSSPSSGVTPSSSPIPPPPPSTSPPLMSSASLPSQGNSPQQGLMTVSLLATQGDVDSLLNSSLDTQPANVSSPPSASPPPTLVPITNIPPPQPLKPQESVGKPPAPPPPAISPHPPPLPPPPSSYSIMLSAAAAANNAQEIGRPGLSSPSPHTHSPTSQLTTTTTMAATTTTTTTPEVVTPFPHSHPHLTALNKSATLPAEAAPSMMNKAATLPARLNNRLHPSSTSTKNNHHLSRPPVIPIHHPQWTLSCLRPNPPVRPNISLPQASPTSATTSTTTTTTTLARNGDATGKANANSNKVASKRSLEDSLLDEAEILRVIEAYCTTVKARNTVNSTFIDSPQVLIAEEEKIIVEERKGNQLVVEEKTLVDTVYALKDQVADILDQMKELKSSLDHERKARKRMEMTIRKTLMKSGAHDMSSSSISVSLNSSSSTQPPPPALPPPLPSQPPPSAPPPNISISNEANNDSNTHV